MSDTEKRERLMLLSDLKELRVAKGEPDIRGWDVVTADRKKMGKVHELVIDTIDMKVRYLDIDVDAKILEVKEKSHILIPIAGAQLDDDDNRVYLNEITVEELRALPPYDHRRITREFETNLTSWFQRSGAAATAAPPATDSERPVAPEPVVPEPTETADPFYEQEHFSDRRFWGERRKGRENASYVTPEESDRDRR